MDALAGLSLVLERKKLEKSALEDSLETLKKLGLVKVGRLYVRPYEPEDFAKSGVPIELYTSYVKLATRLERGKYRRDPVLYSQGVLGLKAFFKALNDPEAARFVSVIYAPNQLPPIYVNELLLAAPTACSLRKDPDDQRILLRFYDALEGKIDGIALYEIPRIHGKYYDALMEYVKGLKAKYEEIKRNLSGESVKYLVDSIEGTKKRSKIDRLRALIRSCAAIEALYESIKNLETRGPRPRPR